MELETDGYIGAVSTTEGDIQEAFLDDDGRGEFIILSHRDEIYVQATGEAEIASGRRLC